MVMLKTFMMEICRLCLKMISISHYKMEENGKMAFIKMIEPILSSLILDTVCLNKMSQKSSEIQIVLPRFEQINKGGYFSL